MKTPDSMLRTPPRILIVKGRTVRAEYRETGIPDYDGNPLIEALPPVLTDDQATVCLARYPQYDEADRRSPDHIRYHLIQNALRCFIPLDIHLDLQRLFSCLIRVGYAGRNPLAAEYWKRHTAKFKTFDQYSEQYQPPDVGAKGAGFNIVGMSGVGKSLSVERVLNLYPQVIHHGHMLATNYRRNYAHVRRTTDELLSDMALVAANHFLGVLVIDEIQRLSSARRGPTYIAGTRATVEVASPEGKRWFRGFRIAEPPTKLPAAYNWFYKNDDHWMRMHTPHHHIEPKAIDIDWGARDIELAAAVRRSAARLTNAPGRPVWISAEAIGRDTGKRHMALSRDDRLPLTNQALIEVIESREAWAIRRIRWAVECYRQKGVCATERDVLARASVTFGYMIKRGIGPIVEEAVRSLCPFSQSTD